MEASGVWPTTEGPRDLASDFYWVIVFFHTFIRVLARRAQLARSPRGYANWARGRLASEFETAQLFQFGDRCGVVVHGIPG